MTEENMAEFRREGENPFSTDNEKDNSNDSPAEETKAEIDPSSGGDNNQSDKNTPLKEHPRWQEREKEWNDKFNAQELRHSEDIRKIREDFGGARKDNAENTKIPSWFGGGQEAWDAYRADRDAEIQQAEERAVARITESSTKQEKAVADATAYMQSEMATIESDTTLNPDGLKVDPEKLLKIVVESDLIDTQGRWNYKAGWKILKASIVPTEKKIQTGNKELAAATGTESKGEDKPATYKTQADFKKNRPW